MDITDSQVKDLAAGISVEIGEGSRPLALTDKDVEALSKGEGINIEKFPALESQISGAERMASEAIESRPRTLTDKDVEALSKGKEIDLQEREPLKPQYP